MELPEDVVARILSKLHPFEAVKAKLVCRTWRRLISTLRVPPLTLGIAVEWHLSSRALLYADLSWSRWVRLPLLDEPASVLAIASPFLCLSTTSSSRPRVTQLHLLNPLSREQVSLPPYLSGDSHFLVGLCTAPSISGFKVVAAGTKALANRICLKESFNLSDADLDLPVQIFDSVGNSWRMAGTVRGVAADYDCPVCVGTQIFWLSKRRLRRHVLAFNAMDETWSILGQSWPEDLCPFALWAWDGHLCMAGGLFNALTVWELATNKSDWLRRIHVTSGVVHPGTFRGVGMMHVAGHGHLLCIMSPWSRKGFVFDLHSHSISWLPLCPVGFYIWGNVHPYIPGFSHL